MPKTNIPNYRLHKASGQAFVELGGRRFYLGKHGSKASREEYEHRIAEYLANGRKLPPIGIFAVVAGAAIRGSFSGNKNDSSRKSAQTSAQVQQLEYELIKLESDINVAVTFFNSGAVNGYDFSVYKSPISKQGIYVNSWSELSVYIDTKKREAERCRNRISDLNRGAKNVSTTDIQPISTELLGMKPEVLFVLMYITTLFSFSIITSFIPVVLWALADYERLMENYDLNSTQDSESLKTQVEASKKALKDSILREAKSITKYIDPSKITSFAILFLPNDKMFVEVLNIAGLFEKVYGHGVLIAGPSTLAAFLSSLRMGFRHIALDKRSSEILDMFLTIKKHIGDFDKVLHEVQGSLQSAQTKVSSAEKRVNIFKQTLEKIEIHVCEEPLVVDENDSEVDAPVV